MTMFDVQPIPMRRPASPVDEDQLRNMPPGDDVARLVDFVIGYVPRLNSTPYRLAQALGIHPNQVYSWRSARSAPMAKNWAAMLVMVVDEVKKGTPVSIANPPK